MNQINEKTPMKGLIVASLLMLVTFAYLKMMSHGEDMPPLKPFSDFPKQIGEWKGKEQYFSQEVYDAVGVDDSTLVSFNNLKNQSIQLYIGYYRSQRKGDLIHSPKHCMPGAGWEITQSSIEPVTLSSGHTMNIIKLNLEKQDQTMVVLYWFHSRGRIINSEYKQKVYLVLDSIFRNRTDGSFVRLISTVHNERPEDTTKRMKQFIDQLIPILNEYLPQ